MGPSANASELRDEPRRFMKDLKRDSYYAYSRGYIPKFIDVRDSIGTYFSYHEYLGGGDMWKCQHLQSAVDDYTRLNPSLQGKLRVSYFFASKFSSANVGCRLEYHPSDDYPPYDDPWNGVFSNAQEYGKRSVSESAKKYPHL